MTSVSPASPALSTAPSRSNPIQSDTPQSLNQQSSNRQSSNQQSSNQQSWKSLLAPFARADARIARFQLVSTLFLWLANCLAIVWSLGVSPWLAAALSCVQGGLFIRLFVLHHDCGHGSFFPTKRWNDRVGRVLGFLTFTPYRYWRRTHAIHHATSGNLDRREFGDITTLTVDEYLGLPWWRRAFYRIYRNPLVLVLVGPAFQFLIKHRIPFDAPLSWRAEWAGVLLQNVLLAGAIAWLWLTFGWQAPFFLVLGPIVVGGALGLWLFYVQHQFEDAYWKRDEDWDFETAGLHGSSYLDMPAWLHWFTGNIGYHHIHHLASRIPNYRLRDCVESIPQLRDINRFTLLESVKLAKLNLWCEATGRLISFREMRTARA